MGISSMRWSLAAGLGVVVALTAGQRPAGAHAIESSLERVSGLTDSLVLQSRFSADQPASDAEVRLVSPSGKSIALGRTDASGTLRFQLPKGTGADWEVQVDQGPGHRDYLELPAASGPSPTPQAGQHLGQLERVLGGRGTGTQLHPQHLALAGLVALGGLGGAALWRRQR